MITLARHWIRLAVAGNHWKYPVVAERHLRHSFVLVLSDTKVPIEVSSRLVGHSGTSATEQIYRNQIRPVIEDGATEMERIFPSTAA